jgi:hypothetical protein
VVAANQRVVPTSRISGFGETLEVLIIGSLFGELLGLILPEGVVHAFFLTKTEIGLGPVTLNLAVATFTIGFTLKINVIGVLGMLFAAYYFRWFR